MKTCPYCGITLEDDMKWCYSCGKQQPEVPVRSQVQPQQMQFQQVQPQQKQPQQMQSQQVQPQQKQPQQMQFQQMQPQQMPAQGFMGQPGQPGKPKNKKTGIIIAAIISVLVLAVVILAVIFFINSNKSEDDDDEDDSSNKKQTSASGSYEDTIDAIITCLSNDDFDSFSKLCLKTSSEDFIEWVYDELRLVENYSDYEIVDVYIMTETLDGDELEEYIEELEDEYDVPVDDLATIQVIFEDDGECTIPLLKTKGKWYLFDD